jgi:hypothetical protein
MLAFYEPVTLGCRRRMYKLHGIIRQGTIDSALTSVRYATLEEARVGARELLRDDRVLRTMIVWNEVPPRFAEWVER